MLGPKKKVEFYRFDRREGKTGELKLQEDYFLDALGYCQGASFR